MQSYCSTCDARAEEIEHVRKCLSSADTIRAETHRPCQGSNLECLLVFFSGKQQQDITRGPNFGHASQCLPRFSNYLPWNGAKEAEICPVPDQGSLRGGVPWGCHSWLGTWTVGWWLSEHVLSVCTAPFAPRSVVAEHEEHLPTRESGCGGRAVHTLSTRHWGKVARPHSDFISRSFHCSLLQYIINHSDKLNQKPGNQSSPSFENTLPTNPGLAPYPPAGETQTPAEYSTLQLPTQVPKFRHVDGAA